MKPTSILLSAVLTMTLSTPSIAATAATPPDVAKKPHVVKAPHGAQRNDEYYWLRDDTRKNPEMLAYLNAENAYADALMAPLKPLENKLYEEIVGRIKQDDSSVPYRERGYWYYTRFETGQDYPIYARRTRQHGRAPRRCCSTSTRWRRARTTSTSATGKSARTTSCWPGPTTPSAAASTRSASRTWPPARSTPTQIDGRRRRTWSGPTTTGRCSTSRTIRKPC